MKSGSLDLVEPSGPVQAGMGIALPCNIHNKTLYQFHMSISHQWFFYVQGTGNSKKAAMLQFHILLFLSPRIVTRVEFF